MPKTIVHSLRAPRDGSVGQAAERPGRWRVAVELEFELDSPDREEAIGLAERLLGQAMPGERLRDGTPVEVVMSLPVPARERR